jgi:hypothetical protein
MKSNPELDLNMQGVQTVSAKSSRSGRDAVPVAIEIGGSPRLYNETGKNPGYAQLEVKFIRWLRAQLLSSPFEQAPRADRLASR